MMIIGRINTSQKFIRVNISVSTSRFFNSFVTLGIAQGLLIAGNLYPTASYNEFSQVTTNIHYVNQKDTYLNLPLSCVTGQECLTADDSCTIFYSLLMTEKNINLY